MICCYHHHIFLKLCPGASSWRFGPTLAIRLRPKLCPGALSWRLRCLFRSFVPALVLASCSEALSRCFVPSPSPSLDGKQGLASLFKAQTPQPRLRTLLRASDLKMFSNFNQGRPQWVVRQGRQKKIFVQVTFMELEW